MASFGSPLKLEPSSPKRRRPAIMWDKCIFCQRPSLENLICMRSISKNSFIEAMNVRRDNIFERITGELSSVDGLLSPNVKVFYHRSCYKTYTSKHNCRPFTQLEENEDTGSIPDSAVIQTRSVVQPGSIDSNLCFICKKKSFKRDFKLHKIESSERLDSLMSRAKEHNDLMMLKTLNKPDFRASAVYHSGCIRRFLLHSTPLKVEFKETEQSAHEVAFDCLISRISDDLFVHKKAFLMSHILEIYKSLLPKDVSENYQSTRLQCKLASYYGSSITIQPQRGQGMSNIVFSSSLTIADAIAAAAKLKSILKVTEFEQGMSAACSEMSEEQILHSASSIIRRDIESLDIEHEFYPNASDVSLGTSLEKMPSTLTKFLAWLIDDKSFEKANEPHVMSKEKLRKVLGLVESIVSVARCTFTPFHLGLAIELYHEYGSRTLIETLFSHGFCASYTEVRRYLTSIAVHEVENMENGAFAPDGIISVQEGGGLIQEGADNIDLNTETIDGKDTFHSMARAVFQTCRSHDDSCLRQLKVRRGQERTFQLTESASTIMSCLPFTKPRSRGSPSRISNAFKKIAECAEGIDNSSELLWVLLRSFARNPCILPFKTDAFDCQYIPFWTGYNSSTSDYRPEFSVVSYAPIVDAKPNDIATVYTTMKRCSDMINGLGQRYSIQTFDQQLYAIAKQVGWAMPETFKTHIVRLGGFHTLSCFIASIGKLWGDCGLKDILVDSSVYAAGTVDQMMCGKQFNRAVRALILVYEALRSLWLSAFFQWCEDNGIVNPLPDPVRTDLYNIVFKFQNGQIDSKSVSETSVLVMTSLSEHLEKFRKFGYTTSPTFKYWDLFLKAIEILILNIRSERQGSWNMHLSSIASMLPYLFVANRVNYSRYLPVYILDMLDLHQDVKSAFESGQFAIRQKPGKFNGVWSDMATEKTVIRDSKGRGGIVGITRQKSALIRWTLCRHVLADFSAAMRKRSGLTSTEETVHEETKPTALRRDEAHVQLIINHVNDRMTNPFDASSHPKALINISTGMHATREIQESLTGAVDEGMKMLQSFVNGTLTEGNNRDFYGPITRSKLKTFEDLTKKTKLKCRSGEVLHVHISPELVFRRALVLATCRDDITVEKVLSFPIGPIPTSLFHEDGTMRKTNKADLCHALESDVTSISQLTPFDRSSTVLIQDGMALLQSMNVKAFKTFGDLAEHFIKCQQQCFPSAATVVGVFDRYDKKLSIKSAERDRRSSSFGDHKVFQLIDGRPIPDWKKFLGVNANKQALLKFLGDFVIRSHSQSSIVTSSDDELYLAGLFSDPSTTKNFTPSKVSDCPDLFSNHEEADTRMLLHAIHADARFGDMNVKGRIIIKSPDTDVLLLCIHFFPSMRNTKELWFKTGTVTRTKDGRRYLPVHDICHIQGPLVCKLLPAVHALTGCDTTSSFFGIGKKTVLKTLKDNIDEFADLNKLCLLDSETSIDVSRNFVARLYDQKGKMKSAHDNLNRLRVKIAKQKDVSLAKLPPCEASFVQHVLRASLQTYIWMKSDTAQPPEKSALDFGWEDQNGLSPVYFVGQTSSDFLKDLLCTCKGKSSCSQGCVCAEQNLTCTELCQCQGTDACCNPLTQTADEDSDDEMNI